jgi:hypothetical protein
MAIEDLEPKKLALAIPVLEMGKSVILDMMRGKPLTKQDIALVKDGLKRVKRIMDTLDTIETVPHPYASDELPRSVP